VFIVAVSFLFGNSSFAEECRRGVVINEIYGGGGNSGSSYKNDFVELYNYSDASVDLSGWEIKYAPLSSENFLKTNLSGTLPARTYYLIQEGSGSGEAQILPTSDAVGSIAMSASAGKIALVDRGGIEVDFVGYNGIGNSLSMSRKNNCDTNDSSDFEVSAPNPQNSGFNENPADPVVPPTDEDDNNEDFIECQADIFFNEIYPFEGEFVELINKGEKECSLEGWVIKDEVNNGVVIEDIFIRPGDFIFIEKDFSLNATTPDKAYLLRPDNTEAHAVPYDKPINKNSYSFNGSGWLWTSILTPGKENEFDPEEDEGGMNDAVAYDHNSVYLNEVFPNPSINSGRDEYIEIYNRSDEDVDLSGWILKDAAKASKYVFPEKSVVKAGKYLAVYKREYKFALNNSGKETVQLIGSDGVVVSQMEYTGSKKDVSYNFDGEKWRKSRYLTPGKENVFDDIEGFEVKVDKKVYKGTYADFEVVSGEDDLKITWDFGDGKKSYKAKTKHKYEDTGRYYGSVILFNGSEEIKNGFEVEVKKFPDPKVRIVQVNPNPTGKDADFESITIKNKSKKEINLNGWSIASGSSSKKFSNHPITEDLIVKAGKILEITRESSKFSLGNKKAKIELRYPDGKVAHDVKYKEEKDVKEGMVYEKKKDGGWEWVKNSGNQSTVIGNQENPDSDPSIEIGETEEVEEIEEDSLVVGEDFEVGQDGEIVSGFGFGEEEDALEVILMLVDELERDLDEIYAQGDAQDVKNVEVIEYKKNAQEDIGKVSEIKTENIFALVSERNLEIRLPARDTDSPKVLGARTLQVDGGEYKFTRPLSKEPHYAVVFMKNISSSANVGINLLLNHFSK